MTGLLVVGAIASMAPGAEADSGGHGRIDGPPGKARPGDPRAGEPGHRLDPGGPKVMIHRLADLRFGAIAVGALPGSLTLSASGARTTVGGVIGLNSHPAGPAIYSLRGEEGRLAHVTLPDWVELRHAEKPNIGIKVDAFTSSLSSREIELTGHPLLFRLGASLHVNANQAPGTYQGTFDVILETE